MIYKCYCDGAVKNNGKKDPNAFSFGGVGIVLTNYDEKEVYRKYFGYAEQGKFGRKITNNIMELYAVKKSIELFIKEIIHPEKQDLIIISDSEYVVKGFNERLYKWISNGWCIQDGSEVSNKDIWKKILDLCDTKQAPRISFKHVKGHNKDKYNEIADELAVQGKNEAIAKYVH